MHLFYSRNADFVLTVRNIPPQHSQIRRELEDVAGGPVLSSIPSVDHPHALGRRAPSHTRS